MRSILLITLFFACLPILLPGQVAGSLLSTLPTTDGPVLLGPGIISTQMGEYSPTYDPIRNELYFMRRTPGQFDYTIFGSTLKTTGWTTPEPVSFSGEYRDAAPYLSPDGNTLYFDSRRPHPTLTGNSIDLWAAQRSPNGWQTPDLLLMPSTNKGSEPTVGQDEFGPAVDAQGQLYFYSFRQPYRGGRHYTASPPAYLDLRLEEDLPDPSASTFVSYLYISPDGQTALLEGRAQGRRDTDIYCACRQQDGSWTPPRALTSVNTKAGEGGPFITADGESLLFTSNRATGLSTTGNANLYLMPTWQIPELCGTEKD
jgi:Tol biopolymer transport system component